MFIYYQEIICFENVWGMAGRAPVMALKLIKDFEVNIYDWDISKL